MIRIAPSILSADFARLADAVQVIESAGADLLHVDVMDGHFVPNLTIGPPVVKALRGVTELPLDCHLMIADPERWSPEFIRAGASWVTVHVEVSPHLHRTVENIRACGAKPGVSLNPATPIETLDEILEDLHHVLVMSVNPGFSGQSFIPRTVRKIRRLAERIDASGLDTVIEVDGGVGEETIADLTRAGARCFVAGSAVFGQDDPGEAVRKLKRLATSATQEAGG